MTQADDALDVVIVGAGFSGLYMLHKCHQMGLRARVYEAGDGVGGTWFWNRYPGARCDTESVVYSYSFDAELQQDWSWSQRYAPQAEILSYLNHVADRFDLRPDIRLETRVTSAVFDESSDAWTVTTDGGEEVRCQFFVTAIGCLSIATAPAWPGQETFSGSVYHTSAWPLVAPDLAGKRVGVVGTGSSAIQAIPHLAREASELVVFQRTPTFSLPARNAATDPVEEAEIKANYPELRRKARTSPLGNFAEVPTRGAFDVSDDERQESYEQRWAEGGTKLLIAFDDIGTDIAANDTVAEFVRDKIRDVVDDPEVAEKLAPRTYPIGTKRICLDTDYFATYNRSNVELVDVSESPIVKLTSKGLLTEAEEYELDVLVFATGFDAITGAFTAIDIRGRNGRSLADSWANGPHTYLGLASADFPNLFMITGPLSPSAMSIVTVSIEQHVEWIADAISYLEQHGRTTMEATEEAQLEWEGEVERAVEQTLHPLAPFTYYWGGNVPGKAKKFLQYPGGVGNYRKICDDVAANDYRGFTLS